MPKSWKGLDGSRLWCIFPDGRCHFVFCINGLNLLALCTYFRGNHSLLSIGPKSSLALQPSWAVREEGGTVVGMHRQQPKRPPSRGGKSLGWGFRCSLPKDGSDWANHRRSAMPKNFPKLPFQFAHFYPRGGPIGLLDSYFNSSTFC